MIQLSMPALIWQRLAHKLLVHSFLNIYKPYCVGNVCAVATCDDVQDCFCMPRSEVLVTFSMVVHYDCLLLSE